MPLLPKPYPDEVVGSIILRGCRHAGVSLKVMLGHIFGTQRSDLSVLSTTAPRRIGALAGLDAEELLWRHTIVPYATAFFPVQIRRQLRAKALALQPDQSLAAITKNVSHAVPYRRACSACVQEDLLRFGESYWHRSHQLPGVELCAHHRIRLHRTELPLRGSTQLRKVLLPQDLVLGAACCVAHSSLAQLLSALSIKALSGALDLDDCCEHYQARARSLGYVLAGGDVAGSALARDLRVLIGEALLSEVQASWSVDDSASWPARLVRPSGWLNIASPKHVLMLAFLSSHRPVDLDTTRLYRPPGKAPRDYAALDRRAAKSVALAAKRAAAQRDRCSAQEVLKQAGLWSAYRHDRQRFPLTTAAVKALRASDQSVRQIGRRECWRRRLGITKTAE